MDVGSCGLQKKVVAWERFDLKEKSVKTIKGGLWLPWVFCTVLNVSCWSNLDLTILSVLKGEEGGRVLSA